MEILLPPHWQFPLALKAPMKVHILERILFFVIACTVIFAGLYIYTYLVSIYQSHWVSIHSSFLSARSMHSTYMILLYSHIYQRLIWGMGRGPLHHPSAMLDGYLSNRSSLTADNPQSSNPKPRSCCQREQATSRLQDSSCPCGTDALPASCTLIRTQVPAPQPQRRSSRSKSRRHLNQRRRCGRKRGLYARCGQVRVDTASASL